MRRSSAEIRQMFLDFFQNKQHTLVTSSPLVPNNDPSLLFTNAGMNQFKNIFLGLETPNYLRAASAQRCLRAGGKHNDLENVGYTARHHTFFEMLGNFSFGDYGKSQAIHFAWELLTSTEWFAIPKERLWITLYENDNETYAIWTTEIGVPAQRIIRIGDNKGAPYTSDNFWQMGETGPCGPCTEIFYDHGDTIPGALPGDLTSEEGERYTEIWNIVFIQFNRQPDGTLLPLPKLSVDTGMGLERMAAVLQEVHSNYETDLFCTLIEKTAQITQSSDRAHPSLQVIADHIRAAAFLIADGVMPSNDGRGYVLRRIIRRAVRHGRLLGLKVPFFYQLTGTLIDVMGPVAALLKQQQALIEKLLISEEQHFIRNLAQSLALLDNTLAQLKGNILSGETAFKLHDTYGLPLDVTIEICQEHNIKVDEVAFEREMTAQRQRAQRSSPLTRNHNTLIQVDSHTTFCGYEKAQETAQVIELWSHGKVVTTLTAGDQAIVILNQTPFYGTSGGQVGDSGWLNGAGMLFTVHDTQHYNRAIGHSGMLTQGTLAIGDYVEAKIDEPKRMKIRCNHSATHLLHAALRQVLGTHVMQKGSLVSADCLRFDFSHNRPLTIEQCWQVEALVNIQIRHNLLIETTLLDLESAKAQGAMALFSEKYDNQVRMLSIGDFSIELCGGTHALRTGDLGLFRIVSESSVAAGVRRIEAFTGEQAIQQMQAEQSQLLQTAALVKGNSKQIVPKIENLLVQQQQLEKKIQQLNQALASRESLRLVNNVVIVKNANLIIKQLQAIEPNILPLIVDDLKNQLKSAIILLASVNNQRVHVIAAVTSDLLSHITAHELINRIKLQIDGKGGGHPEMAQATGNKISTVPAALTAMMDWIIARI